MLTTAHQYHRLPSPENSTISRAYSASKALSASRAFSSSRSSSSSRPLTSTESFLRHTSSSSARANSRGKFLLSASTKQLLGSVDDSEAQPGMNISQHQYAYTLATSSEDRLSVRLTKLMHLLTFLRNVDYFKNNFDEIRCVSVLNYRFDTRITLSCKGIQRRKVIS